MSTRVFPQASFYVAGALLAGMWVSACAGGPLTTREKGAVVGAAGGAAAGGLIGSTVDRPGTGALIGGAMGLGAGALIGDQLQAQERQQHAAAPPQVVYEERSELVVVEKDRRGPPSHAPAHGWRRKQEKYHYYPAAQVYYYPRISRYYWIEGGKWKVGARLPGRYVIHQHEVVVLQLDYEPHSRHARIKKDYPPDYFVRGKGKKRGES